MKIKADPLIRTSTEWTLEVIGLIAMAVTIFYPLYYYQVLPDTIPIHFDFQSRPNGYAGKTSIWFVAGIGIVIFAMLTAITKIPEQHNYPTKITTDNAQLIYRNSQHHLIWLKAVMSILFAFISIMIVYSALIGHASWMTFGFWLLMISIFGVIFRMIRTTKDLGKRKEELYT